MVQIWGRNVSILNIVLLKNLYFIKILITDTAVRSMKFHTLLLYLQEIYIFTLVILEAI